MKNLHLMPMGSIFDDDLVTELNANFPLELNVFYHAEQRERLKDVDNSFVAPSAFTPEFINEHAKEYNKIFLHSLFLSPDEILRLTDDAAKKIVWIVWGHDLYTVKKKQKWTASRLIKESIHTAKKIIRGTYIRAFQKNRAVARKVGLFHAIGIGYYYDEKEIRKKYGKTVPVVYGPYFSKGVEEEAQELRKKHLNINKSTIDILIGHSGYEFLEHEKNLLRLSKYKDENIRIHMVLSYGASEDRIQMLTAMAENIFGKEKCVIQTEMMDKKDYFNYLTNIDVAIFSFKHQSALANAKRLLFMGAKLYLNPKGVLYKGFRDGGAIVYDCSEIGRVSFNDFCYNDRLTETTAQIFSTYSYKNNIDSWRNLLQ